MAPTRIHTSPDGKPALRAVDPVDGGTRWFCGYCAAAASTPPPHARVCDRCGLGLLLEARADVAPASEEPFLVVDAQLTVQAVSRRAEELLGVSESNLVGHPITELITDAETEPDPAQSFLGALAGAAIDEEDHRSAFVRPRGTFGIRIRARIGHCGPPRAALIVLEPPGPTSGDRLRLVRTEQPHAARQRG